MVTEGRMPGKEKGKQAWADLSRKAKKRGAEKTAMVWLAITSRDFFSSSARTRKVLTYPSVP